MAYQNKFGTFVHIPKCAGLTIRKALRTADKGQELEPFHGIPPDIEDGFALVRHPVDWLRSYWAYRNNSNWVINYNKNGRMSHVLNWPVIFGLTQWAKGLSWEQFVDGLVKHRIDVVSKIYGMYDHPNVKIYHLEEIDVMLNNIGLDVTLEVTHKTPNKPKVTQEQRDKLEWVCYRSMVDYGYAEISENNYIAEVADLRKLARFDKQSAIV